MSENQDTDAAQRTAVAAGVQLELVNRRFKGGAAWFFWIAGLSLVNSVVLLAGRGGGFVIGLGITQIVDSIAGEVAAGAEGNAALLVKAAAFGVDLVFAGIFVLFGVLARRKHSAAFITGMILYGLDALIFLMVRDWLSIAFHVLALLGLYSGLKALSQLTALDREAQAAGGPPGASPPTGGDEAP